MFTSQMKRRRDEEGEEDTYWDEERGSKRVRSQAPQYTHHPSHTTIPVRPSLFASLPPLPPELASLTPANSSPSDTEGHSPRALHDAFQSNSALLSSPRIPNPLRGGGSDMDMDDAEMEEIETDDHDDFDMVHSPPYDGSFPSIFSPPIVRPAPLDATLFRRRDSMDEGKEGMSRNAAGRIPTPMYPNFPASTTTPSSAPRSNDGSLSAGTHSTSNLLGVPAPHHPTFIPIPHAPPISQLKKHARISDNDRARRMPSPISEDEDFPDTPTALTQSQLERLSVTGEQHPFHMDTEEPTSSMPQDAAPDSTPSTVPDPPGVVTTPTRGRKRSGALSSARGRFSMGYREDCEKCRMRVPGHYSHFLPN